MATPEEEIQKRLEETRRRQQAARERAQGLRETTGNQQERTLRDRFREGRGRVRGGARAAGRVAGATAAETAGVASEVAGGVGEGLSGSRAGQAAKQTTTRAAEGLRRAGQGARSFGSRLGSLATRGAGVVGAGLALGQEALDTPKDELPARFSRLNPITAPGTAVTDFGLRRARGEGFGQAVLGAARGAVAPISFGLIDQPEDDPFRGTQPTLRESLLNRGEEAQLLEQVQGATGTGGQTQAATINQATGTTAGEPPAGTPQPAEQRGGVPAAGSGFFVNQRTGERTNLNFPQERERDIGLRATQRAPEGDTNRRLLDRLARQASEGGLASAFAGLGVGKNILQQEATQRQRQEQRQQQQQKFENELGITLAGQQSKIAALPLKQQEQYASELRSTLDALQSAEEEGNEAAVNREKDLIASQAISRPDGPQAAIFSTIVSQEIQDLADPGLFDLIGLGSGRDLIDVLTESEEPVVSLNPEDTVFFDRESGKIRQRSTTPGEGPQDLTDFNALPKRSQDFLRARGILTGRDEEGNKRLEAGSQAARGGLRQR